MGAKRAGGGRIPRLRGAAVAAIGGWLRPLASPGTAAGGTLRFIVTGHGLGNCSLILSTRSPALISGVRMSIFEKSSSKDLSGS